MKKLLKNQGWKTLNVVLLLCSIFIYFSSEIFWQNNCLGGNCSVNFMEGTLSSLKNAGIFLSLIFLIFVFLPQAYFKHYAKVWLWWILLLSYVVTVATDPVGGSIISFDRSQVVVVLGTLNVIVAIGLVYRFWSKQKINHNKLP